MKNQPRFGKVVVQGKIQLGQQRELVQQPLREQGSKFTSAIHGPKHQHDAVSPGDLNRIGSILEFSLSETGKEDLFIEDEGLVTSFGIFGAPGSGKTHLLNHMLAQLLSHEPDEPRRRYGALILDPKAGLVDEVRRMTERAGRMSDLRIIGTGEHLNVIDCHLDPHELGSILVLAARSAGIGASDPFWFQEWSNIFAASLSILRLWSKLRPSTAGVRPVTLRMLVDSIFETLPSVQRAGFPAERSILRTARLLRERLGEIEVEFGPGVARDFLVDAAEADRFFRQTYTGTIEAFITKAYGMFRRSRLDCYSDGTTRLRQQPFYEDIIENGRIVLVSIAPSEPTLAKTLCTLVKCLFQRTVLSRGDLLATGKITNDVRPMVIACDEYSEIASEVPGQSMGDGQFLALARQYGCMAILATQSVNVLESSSLRETWKSVFSNFAAKIYMRLADNETAEGATKLAAESDWKVTSRGTSIGGQGHGASTQDDLRQRPNLPSSVLTQVLRRGEAVVIGALDGGITLPRTRFLKVPFPLPHHSPRPMGEGRHE